MNPPSKLHHHLLLTTTLLTLASCTSPPRDVTPVTNFDSARYLGTWYEIARLAHPFERDLSSVTATYTKLVAKAQTAGFNTTNLIPVRHDNPTPPAGNSGT